MSTQKVVLRTIEEFMSDYTPVYQPLYSVFLGKSQSYSEEAGKLDFRRVDTVGDVRAKHVTPKDSELELITINESKKSFRKYFLANQFRMSQLQSQEGTEITIAKVLDEHQMQMDELFLFGEGTSAGNVINNGLYHSADSNYELKDSIAVPVTDRLYKLHGQVIQTATEADRIAGKKMVVFYGTDILPLYDELYPTAVKPFKVALQEVLGNNYSTMKMPAQVTPAGQSGWMIVNEDQIKTHYTSLPKLKDQGSNNEKMYNWFNFLMGSCMVDVLAKGGIIRQPATLAE